MISGIEYIYYITLGQIDRTSSATRVSPKLQIGPAQSTP